MLNASQAWITTLTNVVNQGIETAPRGKNTKELIHQTTTFDMTSPVVNVAPRKMNYQFMAAEAYWILSGDNSVAGIAPYNKHIGQFSDNGVAFAGAYGPRIIAQLNYVVSKLAQDRDTRQAVLTIWNPNPAPSKDIPCTVAFAFQIRNNKLMTSVFMRSSDCWLGLPYDMFNFSMLSYLICIRYNKTNNDKISPGILNLTAASSHLYEDHWESARGCLGLETLDPKPAPAELWEDEDMLMRYLEELRNSKADNPIRWW